MTNTLQAELNKLRLQRNLLAGGLIGALTGSFLSPFFDHWLDGYWPFN